MSDAKTPDTAPTEARNPRTLDLDQLPPRSLLARILEEDATVPAAVLGALPQLERASNALLATLQGGGRWFNLGAGTSGRLGALDAAEIPPTYGLDPERVQALIAGGPKALLRAVESAEDNAAAAARDLSARNFSSNDALLALSASGQTPYALGAVEFARELGATTIGITCAAHSPLATAVDIAIAVEVGPDVVAGSTRMKGGLAQKMILHALSTSVMVRLGLVRSNLMTGMRGFSCKLRERAVRIVMELSARSRPEATDALEATDGNVEQALAHLEALTPAGPRTPRNR